MRSFAGMRFQSVKEPQIENVKHEHNLDVANSLIYVLKEAQKHMRLNHTLCWNLLVMVCDLN